MKNKFLKFFDILEDKIRQKLSRYPIFYAVVGLLGIVLTWRGIWYVADQLLLPGWASAILGISLLAATGLLVALAIGDEVLIAAFRGRQKVTEVKLEETLTLSEKVDEIKTIMDRIEKQLKAVKKEEKEIEQEIKKQF